MSEFERGPSAREPLNTGYIAAAMRIAAESARSLAARYPEVDASAVAQETLMKLLSTPAGADGARDPRRGGRERVPTGLIWKIAHDKTVDAVRHEARRPRTSLDAHPGLANRASSTAEDPLLLLVRREEIRERLEPLFTFRKDLVTARGEVGARIFAGLLDGTPYRKLAEEVCRDVPGSGLTEGALRQLIARELRSRPGVAAWLRRRRAPTEAASRGGGRRTRGAGTVRKQRSPG